MNVSRKGPNFQPVTITLNFVGEVAALKGILSAVIDHNFPETDYQYIVDNRPVIITVNEIRNTARILFEHIRQVVNPE